MKRLLMASVCIVGLSNLNATAGEQVNFTAVKTNHSEKFEPLFEDKQSGRMAAMLAYSATLKQTSGGDLMDGMKNTGTGYIETTNGRGHAHGWDVLEKGGDLVKWEWAGECYMIPNESDGGKPVQQCAGGWSVVPGSGTGRYANLSGGGSWKAQATPQGEYDVQDAGYLSKESLKTQ
jgi:hypothetical protein